MAVRQDTDFTDSMYGHASKSRTSGSVYAVRRSRYSVTQFLKEFVTQWETGCLLPFFLWICVLNQMNAPANKHPACTTRVPSIPLKMYQFLILSLRSTRPSISPSLYFSDPAILTEEYKRHRYVGLIVSTFVIFF
jgi:hypothetical protein